MIASPKNDDFDPERGDFDPEAGEFSVGEINIPSVYKSPEEFLAAQHADEKTLFGSPMYFANSKVPVNLKRVNWEEVRRLRGEPEPTGVVAAVKKHAKRISGAFGL
ncbi:MAG: hypothetical protein NTZ25_05380 [Candidatus Peregrinibacteria bacterium]|nr:hypothetical protein [Candidatus Peregrinibacteria bacterium]